MTGAGGDRPPDLPRVSVIVPNYRHAPYLPRRIESILGQTFGNFELLILDDCSPDDSRAVIARYAAQDRRIRTLFNAHNGGNPYLQWQKGLAHTAGDYVWIAESDDWADPTLLERLVTALDAEPDAGLAFCETQVVDEADRLVRPYFRGEDDELAGYDLAPLATDFVMDGRDYLRRFMLPWNTIPNASAVLFRRRALAAAGGPVATMRLCGDWLTYCRILAGHRVAHVGARLNYFRTHQVNVRSSTKAEVLVAEVRQVIAWAERELGRLPRAARANLRGFYVNVLLGAERARGGGRVPLRRLPAALARLAGEDMALLPDGVTALLRDAAGRLRPRGGRG